VVHRQSFAALRHLFRTGELSPVAVARSALDHARSVDARLNAFAVLDPERALAAARRSEQRWRSGSTFGNLDGMPVTVKEFAGVRGWPTRRGSLTTPTEPAVSNSIFVERLEAGGAVLLGKTRSPEFNWKGVTDSPGFGITRNPWRIDLTPGGSSGGCAAAVASGVVRVSFGSDAGGSVRVPAAFTGVLGLKPTFGLVPLAPPPSHFSNLAHVGLLASSSADMSEALQTVAGRATTDWTSVSETIEARAACGAAIASLRVGVLNPARWDDAAPVVRAGVGLISEVLRVEGLNLRDVDFDLRGASDVGRQLYELACAQIVSGIEDHERELVDPNLLSCAEAAGRLGLSDYFRLAQRRDADGASLAALFETVDVMVLPTVPIVAFDAGRDVPNGWPDPNWMSWNPYTPAFNALHVPALTYPVLPEPKGLPVGVQLVAPRLHDRLLINFAGWLEKRLPVRLPPVDDT
jgi:aspartyl-tRNA(Asn)/glutamyl-tRNA(Gln) amidotransferase subunit A